MTKLTDIYKEQLKEYYQTDTEYFDNLDGNFYNNVDEYTQLLQPEYFKNKKVLDAGCGSGAFAHWITENYGSEVTGVDLSPYAIAEANRKYKGKFIVGDISELPFKARTFDTVLLYDVLEHVIYPHNVFAELRRVLKKNGHIIIVSPNMMFNPNVPKMIKLKEVFETVTLPFKRTITMNYVEPDVSQCACGDKEAALITNPFKISKLLKEHKFEIEKNIFGRCIFIAKKL